MSDYEKNYIEQLKKCAKSIPKIERIKKMQKPRQTFSELLLKLFELENMNVISGGYGYIGPFEKNKLFSEELLFGRRTDSYYTKFKTEKMSWSVCYYPNYTKAEFCEGKTELCGGKPRFWDFFSLALYKENVSEECVRYKFGIDRNFIEKKNGLLTQ